MNCRPMENIFPLEKYNIKQFKRQTSKWNSKKETLHINPCIISCTTQSGDSDNVVEATGALKLFKNITRLMNIGIIFFILRPFGYLCGRVRVCALFIIAVFMIVFLYIRPILLCGFGQFNKRNLLHL